MACQWAAALGDGLQRWGPGGGASGTLAACLPAARGWPCKDKLWRLRLKMLPAVYSSDLVAPLPALS